MKTHQSPVLMHAARSAGSTSMNGLPALLLSLLSIHAAGRAQVSPVNFAMAEGPSVGFLGAIGTSSAPHRQLQVDGSLIGLGPRTIHEIRFRRDGQTNAPSPQFTALVRVWMSHAATTPGAPAIDFDNNHGADRTEVLTPTTITFGNTVPQSLPEPFDTYVVPLTQAFAYDGQRPICWDILVMQSSAPPLGVSLDAFGGPLDNPSPIARSFGAGCAVPGSSPLAVAGVSAGANWLAPTPLFQAAFVGVNLPANAPTALILDLAPLRPPVAYPGRCTLYVSPQDYRLSTTTTTGVANTLMLNVPLSPAYNGLSLFAQYAAFDTASMNYVATDGMQINIIAPSAPQVALVHKYGGPQGVIPTRGAFALLGTGAVVEYR